MIKVMIESVKVAGEEFTHPDILGRMVKFCPADVTNGFQCQPEFKRGR